MWGKKIGKLTCIKNKNERDNYLLKKITLINRKKYKWIKFIEIYDRNLYKISKNELKMKLNPWHYND